MEERKAALAPEKTAAKAMSGIAPMVSPGETTIDEAGGQGDRPNKSVKTVFQVCLYVVSALLNV